MGAFTPILYAFREREWILKLFEDVSGARLTYSHILIGGVATDVTEDWLTGVADFCEYFKPKIDDYNNLLTYNKIFIERAINIGILPVDMAIAYGTSGPVLRGSGVEWDIRKKHPYSIYDRFDFDIPVGSGEKGTIGDCWDRYIVRIREMSQSVRIIEQALKGIPEGEFRAKIKRVLKPKPGEVYVPAENPKGELGFYIVSNGTDKPERVKVRVPSFANVTVVPEISTGMMIADLVAILGSIDIVMGEIDR
jgi:NADH-quinone oxidoreductase subunit D